VRAPPGVLAPACRPADGVLAPVVSLLLTGIRGASRLLENLCAGMSHPGYCIIRRYQAVQLSMGAESSTAVTYDDQGVTLAYDVQAPADNVGMPADANFPQH
jgi:hypothetical protein